MKVLLNTGSYAFRLHRPVLEALWESNPELFDDEPMPKEEFDGLVPAGSGRTLLNVFDWAVERDGVLHFLTLFSPQLRTLPALIARAELGEELGTGLRVVNAPNWPQWHVFVFENGRESVCENHGEVRA
jgi:hypothetical protein